MYKYEFVKGHCIVEIEGKKWLIDTGAPSFSFDNNITSVMINGCKHSVMPRLDFKDAVDRVVGMEVTGIIGFDILSKTSFSMDNENNFSFGLENIKTDNHINVTINKNIIVGKISVDNKLANVLFDTGAHINYIHSSLANPNRILNEASEMIDYDFFNRKIVSKQYFEVLDFDKLGYKVFMAVPKDINSYPVEIMNTTNCQAIVGLYNLEYNDPIFHECFGIDYKNKKLFIH